MEIYKTIVNLQSQEQKNMDEELKGIRCREGQRRGRAVEFETVQWDRMPRLIAGKFANNTTDTGTDPRNNNSFWTQNNIGKG